MFMQSAVSACGRIMLAEVTSPQLSSLHLNGQLFFIFM
jgi:hypothetical protein